MGRAGLLKNQARRRDVLDRIVRYNCQGLKHVLVTLIVLGWTIESNDQQRILI
jgi:hypothetical protein